jgi:hypothetical protein
MLVACRLAGLSALETHYAEIGNGRATRGRVWLRCLACRPAPGHARPRRERRDVILRLVEMEAKGRR